MSEIELLRSGNQYMCGEIDLMRARIEALEAALKPFKVAADGFDECGCGDGLRLSTDLVNVGMLRRAREVLADQWREAPFFECPECGKDIALDTPHLAGCSRGNSPAHLSQERKAD